MDGREEKLSEGFWHWPDIPIEISSSEGTHYGPDDEAQIGHQSPNPYHPNAVSRIEHILDATNDYGAGDCGEEPTEDSTENNAFD